MITKSYKKKIAVVLAIGALLLAGLIPFCAFATDQANNDNEAQYNSMTNLNCAEPAHLFQSADAISIAESHDFDILKQSDGSKPDLDNTDSEDAKVDKQEKSDIADSDKTKSEQSEVATETSENPSDKSENVADTSALDSKTPNEVYEYRNGETADYTLYYYEGKFYKDYNATTEVTGITGLSAKDDTIYMDGFNFVTSDNAGLDLGSIYNQKKSAKAPNKLNISIKGNNSISLTPTENPPYLMGIDGSNDKGFGPETIAFNGDSKENSNLIVMTGAATIEPITVVSQSACVACENLECSKCSIKADVGNVSLSSTTSANYSLIGGVVISDTVKFVSSSIDIKIGSFSSQKAVTSMAYGLGSSGSISIDESDVNVESKQSGTLSNSSLNDNVCGIAIQAAEYDDSTDIVITKSLVKVNTPKAQAVNSAISTPGNLNVTNSNLDLKTGGLNIQDWSLQDYFNDGIDCKVDSNFKESKISTASGDISTTSIPTEEKTVASRGIAIEGNSTFENCEFNVGSGNIDDASAFNELISYSFGIASACNTKFSKCKNFVVTTGKADYTAAIYAAASESYLLSMYNCEPKATSNIANSDSASVGCYSFYEEDCNLELTAKEGYKQSFALAAEQNVKLVRGNVVANSSDCDMSKKDNNSISIYAPEKFEEEDCIIHCKSGKGYGSGGLFSSEASCKSGSIKAESSDATSVSTGIRIGKKICMDSCTIEAVAGKGILTYGMWAVSLEIKSGELAFSGGYGTQISCGVLCNNYTQSGGKCKMSGGKCDCKKVVSSLPLGFSAGCLIGDGNEATSINLDAGDMFCYGGDVTSSTETARNSIGIVNYVSTKGQTGDMKGGNFYATHKCSSSSTGQYDVFSSFLGTNKLPIIDSKLGGDISPNKEIGELKSVVEPYQLPSTSFYSYLCKNESKLAQSLGYQTFYDVTFNSNGGTSVEKQTVVDGSLLTEPVCTKEGYALAGWFEDPNFTGDAWDFNNDVVYSNSTLYAKWLKVNIEIPQDPDITVNENDMTKVFESAVKKNPQATEIKLKLDVKKGETSQEDLAIIKQNIGDKKLVSNDVAIYITITEGSSEPITKQYNDNDVVLGIGYKFDFSGKDNLECVRVHSGQFSKLSEDPNVDNEYVEFNKDDQQVVIHAMKYSAYALSYDLSSTPGQDDNPANNASTSDTASLGSSTGDSTPIALFALCCIAALAIVGFSSRFKRLN